MKLVKIPSPRLRQLLRVRNELSKLLGSIDEEIRKEKRANSVTRQEQEQERIA